MKRNNPPPTEAAYSQPTETVRTGPFFHRAVPVDNSAGPAKVDLTITGLNPTNNSQRVQTASTLLAPATESLTYCPNNQMMGTA